ncbi:transcription factor VOZ1-like protein [Trifolium pratense]|uniref:Transcription factor VOZ1-like protein n=2 Tax=Trifolium pratense TaxID=57577 RepID=A0A2K3MPD6_TRIPR|nr:transcription factor VOZ1-like protein [Trifolium pratense]
MKKISKGSCKTASHRLFKDKAKNHVDDLQVMFLDLQFARKESRSIDAALLEEQVHQILWEWRAGLNEPSSAASLKQGGSHGSFSTDICRLLQLCEDEDDATSLLVVPRPEPNDQTMQTDADAKAQNVHFWIVQGPHKGWTCVRTFAVAPVLRPGGIGLNDNLLLAALSANAKGKDVGIPECEGAAVAKSPWNAPGGGFSLISPEAHLRVETESEGPLPDYNGQGWRESRKHVMNEFGELKRSYYMDPQPLNHFEWHLYEYEISKCDSRALYWLEFKCVDGKKSSKAKITSDSVTNMQTQIVRLSAEFPYDSRRSAMGRGKPDAKADIGCVYTASNNAPSPYDYLVENTNDYYVSK